MGTFGSSFPSLAFWLTPITQLLHGLLKICLPKVTLKVELCWQSYTCSLTIQIYIYVPNRILPTLIGNDIKEL